jgi:hypothetical protein
MQEAKTTSTTTRTTTTDKSPPSPLGYSIHIRRKGYHVFSLLAQVYLGIAR